MAWKWYDSTVIKIEDQTPTTKRFFVEIPAEEPVNFTAGQFVTMDLPINEKRLKRWRSYSIANAPNGSNILEFSIVRLDGGAATEYLFNELKVGDNIRFKGPDGTFVLPDPIEKDLVLICTGTGVAPYRSMLIDLQKNHKKHKNIHLIFGTRYEENILYRDEFEKLEKEIPGFKYSITLSRDENWKGFKGYVHQVYLEDYKTVRPDVDFYICGWSNMIDDVVANLILKLGYDKSQVHYELYG
jgi:phenol/toluene 2-monooxygenase (NADH) P5/A5